MLRPAFLDACRGSCLRRRSGSRLDDLVRSDPKTNDKDKGKDAAVAEMLFGLRSRFLHCAAHDETVSSFGRNDSFLWLGGESKDNGVVDERALCHPTHRKVRDGWGTR